MTSRIRQAHHYRGLPNTLQFQETQVRLRTKLFPLDLVLAVAPKLAPSPRLLSTFSQAPTFSYVYEYVILSDKSVCQLVNNYWNLINVNTCLRLRHFNDKFQGQICKHQEQTLGAAPGDRIRHLLLVGRKRERCATRTARMILCEQKRYQHFFSITCFYLFAY